MPSVAASEDAGSSKIGCTEPIRCQEKAKTVVCHRRQAAVFFLRSPVCEDATYNRLVSL